jgi:threonine/homoserine/homoserine lactone efflux protein
MLDARYVAFASISALLVISPGASMAVVMEAAVSAGRSAALFTVFGINIANASLGAASALGMSFVFHQWPWAMQVIRVGGAAYLSYLGIRKLGQLWKDRASPDLPATGTGQPGSSEYLSNGGRIRRGIATNFLNPSVVIFYMTFLPQFVGPQDPFFARFLLLAATHVSMSLAWLSLFALTLGAMATVFARPHVRRSLDALTGAVLVGLGVRLLMS